MEPWLHELLRQLTVELRRLRNVLESQRETASFEIPARQQALAGVAATIPVPQKLDFLDAVTLQVGADTVQEVALQLGDILVMTSLDDGVWWSPRRFTTVYRQAAYLPPGTQMIIRHAGWQRLYLRADTTETRVSIALFRIIQD